MRRTFFALIVLVNLMFPKLCLSYIEQTDTILNDKENAIYMIGSIYNRLTDAKTTSKEDSYRIYKIDLKDNSKTIFYENDQRRMDRLLLSPNGNYIAVTRYEKDSQTEILIVDRKLGIKADLVNVPEGILSYVWSPDSRKIAYLTGTYKEFGEVSSKGIWVYDIEKKDNKKISDSARGIEWLPTGQLCLYNEYVERKGDTKALFFKTLIYDDTAGKVTAEKKGIYLSQDGRYSTDPKYYLLPEDQVTDKIVVDFFDLQKGTTILGSTLDKIFSQPISIAWGGDILWLKGNRIVVERRNQNDPYFNISICDFESNKVLKEFKGRVVGVNSSRSKLVVFFAGNLSVVDVP